MSTHTFIYKKAFLLEGGAVLPGFHLSYTIQGSLNAERDNVVWICHALTANADPEEWWPGLVGPGCFFDPNKYLIVCANMLGSCYGSTYALSPNPKSGEPWYHDFPILTNRDIVRAFDLLRQHLALDRVHALIGGSLGGQQLLEWAWLRPEVFDHIIPLATNARHSPWGIAFNEAQRMAIAADPSWQERSPEAGAAGLRAARAVALLSYRGYEAYGLTQAEAEEADHLEHYRASSYQQYQGDKLVRRFDAFAYWTLSKAMDSHHLGRGRGSVQEALRAISCPTLSIAIQSDGLFPPSEQRLIADSVPHGTYVEIPSTYGHDGFLIEVEAIAQVLTAWLTPVRA